MSNVAAYLSTVPISNISITRLIVAPMGQLPRSVDVILEGDLVDRVKPGDRVRMVGIYRALAGNVSGQTSGIFRTVILGNNVLQIGKDVGGVVMTPNDIQNIRAVAKRDNCLLYTSPSPRDS